MKLPTTVPIPVSLDTLLASLPAAPRVLQAGGERRMFCDVVSDSRAAGADTLFVCIRGANSDGHNYILAAYEAGCRAFFVEAPFEPVLPPDATLLQSDDTHRDLAYLTAAAWGNPGRRMRVVGITGTKGKTTVAMLAYQILVSQGVKAGYVGTSGVLFGDVKWDTSNTTPPPGLLQRYLSAMVGAGVEVVLMEVSSQALWQHRTDGIPLSVAVLTNLSVDHIGSPEHPDFAHYAACKKRLLTDFGAPLVIANADDEHTLGMLRGVECRVETFGIYKEATLRAAGLCHDRFEPNGDDVPFVHFKCQDAARGENVPISLPLPGEHNVCNAVCALLITRALGIPMRMGARSLRFARVPGRFEVIRHPAGAIVVIDFAHNGTSMRAILKTLRGFEPRRLLCLFGSIGERTKGRRRDLGEAADKGADFSYLTADDPGTEDPRSICEEIAGFFLPAEPPHYAVIPDRGEAIRTALSDLKSGDILLITGKGDERFQRVGKESLPWCDRDAVENWCAVHENIR